MVTQGTAFCRTCESWNRVSLSQALITPPQMDFLFQWCPVRIEEGMLLHKHIEEIRVHAIREAAGDDDTLIQPSRIPL